ncbi:unnamed protein product [Ophioblennius macclurei]
MDCFGKRNMRAISQPVSTMQELQMGEDDDNGAGRRKRCREKPGRRLFLFLFLGFGALCILQVVLNIVLRTAYSSSKTSACNSTDVGVKKQTVPEVAAGCEEMKSPQCNKLQDRFNALTAEKNLLEDRISQLNNKIRTLEDDIQSLQTNVAEPSDRCISSQWCPAGWTEINSRCYFLSTEQNTWQESRKYCQSKNADLVVIKGLQEQRAIYRMNGDQDLLFWIGLHGTNRNFNWVDGSALTNGYWQVGQPDHGGPNNVEDCVEMYHRKPDVASWNDAPCGHRLRWLCEKEPCQETPREFLLA